MHLAASILVLAKIAGGEHLQDSAACHVVTFVWMCAMYATKVCARAASVSLLDGQKAGRFPESIGRATAAIMAVN